MAKLLAGLFVEPVECSRANVGKEVDKDCDPEYPGKVARVLFECQQDIMLAMGHTKTYHGNDIGGTRSGKGTKLGNHEL